MRSAHTHTHTPFSVAMCLSFLLAQPFIVSVGTLVFFFVSFVVSTDYVVALVCLLVPAARLDAYVFEISPSLYSLIILKVFYSHTVALNQSLCLDW